ncbi:MAG TPA: cupin domain-containing protein [Candidatus Limnocylindrales bacterium]|nr:cupin domain-containing protein [Candidatus Limnocylindrales bacterium]
MNDLADLEHIPPIQVFTGVRVRRVQGDLVTLAVVELDPHAVVPEHRHPSEQHGMVITGQMDFRIGDERRTLGPGGTWRIRSDTPHEAHAGPEGAVVIDVFAPVRADWDELPMMEPSRPVWPSAGGG